MPVNGKTADIGYGPIIGRSNSTAAASSVTAGNVTRIVDGSDVSHRFQVTISSVGAGTTAYVVKYTGGQAARRAGQQRITNTAGMRVIDIEPEYLEARELLKVKVVGIDSSGRGRNVPVFTMTEPEMFEAYAVDLLPSSAEQVPDALYGVLA